MIVPIFIHVKEKSDKEIREEMARERRWRELMEAEEEAKKRREREALEEKRRKEREERELAEKKYREALMKDPWDYQFLPEGWDILGQRYFPVITEYYDE